jgi:preprotein translocase subunit SecF
MIQIVERRRLWFSISVIAILPFFIYLIWAGATGRPLLPLSIDYTGGTIWEIRFNQDVQPATVRQIFVDAGFSDTTVFNVGDDQTVQVKFKPVTAEQKDELKAGLTEAIGEFEERSYRSLGPVLGEETSRAAVFAIALASVLIMLYIAWAFRQVPHPFRYGAAAIVALVHDVLVVLAFVCVMNWLAGWEIDALTLTAILTVIGFSVNDTVVVFDRIRENLRRYRGESFNTIANRSLLETATRSLGTQITALLVLVALLVLGGATLQQFTATLVAGFISGMYSSIFNATPLLAAWDEHKIFHSSKRESVAGERPAAA